MPDYPWKRFWCPRGGVILLTERGYLADPDSCLHFDLRAYGSEQQLQRALFDHPEILSWQGDTSVLYLFLDSLDESLLRVDTVTDMIAQAS